MNLTDKIVWITGASSGIGEALAHEFAKDGAKLVLSARRLDELERVKKSLNLPDASVLTLPIDMLKPEEFGAKTQTILQHFGRIDVLVPNAGISQREKFLDIAPADFQKLMDTNFTSVVLLTREVLPHLLAQKSGGILVTSSVSGKIGTSFRTFYCASKHAIQGFFDSLRGEVWRDGIVVTVACPDISKPIFRSMPSAKTGNLLEKWTKIKPKESLPMYAPAKWSTRSKPANTRSSLRVLKKRWAPTSSALLLHFCGN